MRSSKSSSTPFPTSPATSSSTSFSTSVSPASPVAADAGSAEQPPRGLDAADWTLPVIDRQLSAIQQQTTSVIPGRVDTYVADLTWACMVARTIATMYEQDEWRTLLLRSREGKKLPKFTPGTPAAITAAIERIEGQVGNAVGQGALRRVDIAEDDRAWLLRYVLVARELVRESACASLAAAAQHAEMTQLRRDAARYRALRPWLTITTLGGPAAGPHGVTVTLAPAHPFRSATAVSSGSTSTATDAGRPSLDTVVDTVIAAEQAMVQGAGSLDTAATPAGSPQTVSAVARRRARAIADAHMPASKEKPATRPRNRPGSRLW